MTQAIVNVVNDLAARDKMKKLIIQSKYGHVLYDSTQIAGVDAHEEETHEENKVVHNENEEEETHEENEVVHNEDEETHEENEHEEREQEIEEEEDLDQDNGRENTGVDFEETSVHSTNSEEEAMEQDPIDPNEIAEVLEAVTQNDPQEEQTDAAGASRGSGTTTRTTAAAFEKVG